MNIPDLALPALRAAYLARTLTPEALLAELDARDARCGDDHIWIHRLSVAERAPYLARLAQADPATLPLYGIPFAIKDNIDLAGVPTTAACPAFAYTPTVSARVVDLLVELGALPLGKTNLDQFATGLVGTRSPYGATRNAFNPDYISGGSSAGSAVACAKGLVSFALGTDTAGSGRVPAAFNALVGVKPTRGVLSTRGVVPACQSLDCVSIFAHDVADATELFTHLAQYDARDPYARPAEPRMVLPGDFRFGIPTQLEFFGDPDAPRLFERAVVRLEAAGGTAVPIDFRPFLDAARLLYEGPWVAERYAAVQAFHAAHADAFHPVTRAILQGSVACTAVAAFDAFHQLQALKREADAVLDVVDCVFTPTAGRAYTLAEVAAEPIRLNSTLGHYTNFMNLLDYAAVAVPMGLLPCGVPLGATLFGPAHSDLQLLELAARYRAEQWTAPATAAAAMIRLVVCGAHLSGLPLNHQLTARGARRLRACRTAPRYRLFALPGGPPARPGLVRASSGAAIEVEEWAMPRARFGEFISEIPGPLAIGRVELEDGSRPHGFLCEAHATEGAEDITATGGWRAYLGRAVGG